MSLLQLLSDGRTLLGLDDGFIVLLLVEWWRGVGRDGDAAIRVIGVLTLATWTTDMRRCCWHHEADGTAFCQCFVAGTQSMFLQLSWNREREVCACMRC